MSHLTVLIQAMQIGSAMQKKVGILTAYSSVTYLMTPKNPPTKRRTSNPISASRYLYKQMHINKSRWGKDDKRC
jgi:hypothetical protein